MKSNYLVLPILLICLSLFSQEKTNVVMIVLDDLNDYVGVMGGHPQAKTPHIDALANSGVLFDNAHSNVPVCSPSRASFMTGILPINSKNWGFGSWLMNETQMNSRSIPEYFKDNGYKTYKTGKVFHADKKGVWDVRNCRRLWPHALQWKKVSIASKLSCCHGRFRPIGCHLCFA